MGSEGGVFLRTAASVIGDSALVVFCSVEVVSPFSQREKVACEA
jgi:hypothetical protein